MPYLNSTVCGLNGKLVSKALAFIPTGDIKAWGIAETILQGERENVKRYPAQIDNDGEGTMIEIDDTYSLVLYHKLESITNSLAPKTGFGDNAGDLIEVANMALIVFGFRERIRKPADVLEAAIKDKLPGLKSTLRSKANKVLQTSVFRVGNSSFDKIALLSREYTEVKYYPGLIGFEMKYRIESTWQKGCFDPCDI